MDKLQSILHTADAARRKRRRMTSLLLALSTLVSASVFRQLTLTGITATDDALCGIAEHLHDETCPPGCALPEHTHSTACFPDLEADVETYDNFIASLPELDGLDGPMAVTVIAQSQLGQKESAANFALGDDGIRRGITRYGQWYGNPYGDWSAMFAAFCLHFAGYTSEEAPFNAGAESMHLAWKAAGLTTANGPPRAGDLLFLDDNADGTAERIAVVVTSAGGQLITIEGDVNGAVAAMQVAADDARIVDIGALPERSAQLGEGVTEVVMDSLRFDADGTAITPVTAKGEPSDKQVVKGREGGTVTDTANDVTVSKYIDGTDVENVFDITLTVTTPQKVEEIISEPDMAVVVVLDLSNSMKTNNMIENGKSVSRYVAALNAAEAFIKKFSESNELGVSKIALVAFNTHAHEVFPLSPCTNAEEREALVKKMRDTAKKLTDKGVINVAEKYGSSTDRYTNIEAGLRLGQDVLNTSNNSNKYIVLLTDGFPTTYINRDEEATKKLTTSLTKYIGHNPYRSTGEFGNDGVFYDGVRDMLLSGGPYYSDKGAIRAREAATEIKAAGTKIFSIGVGIGEYTIQDYIAGDKNSTTIDCGDGTFKTGTVTIYKTDSNNKPYTLRRSNVRIYNYDFEIGPANYSSSFKNWLKGGTKDGASFGIGSGEEIAAGKTISYYHDSTDTEGIEGAFDNIFESIKILNAKDAEALWVTSDTLPIHANPLMKEFEFIGFFENSNSETATPTLLGTDVPLVGRNSKGVLVENTASIAEIDDKSGGKIDEIRWDLKNSVPMEVTSGDTTNFIYKLTYRVRLENENYDTSKHTSVFVENTSYNTNANASLTYRILKSTTANGQTTVTIINPKPLVFPIPAVKGYLGEFGFEKIDNYDRMVEGATFHLTHHDSCTTCRGDGKNAVTLDSSEARFNVRSDADGKVNFTGIPSGHTYLMTETPAAGYSTDNLTWTVNIAFDTVTITQSKGAWNGVVRNYTSYELPNTGGGGSEIYLLAGLILLLFPIVLAAKRRRAGN